MRPTAENQIPVPADSIKALDWRWRLQRVPPQQRSAKLAICTLPSPCFIGAVESGILVNFFVLKIGVFWTGPVVAVSRLVVILVPVASTSYSVLLGQRRGRSLNTSRLVSQ